jgi:conjugal transfer mating pair stabilization protein TraG
MRVSEQDVQDASRQVDAARSESVAASQERSTVLADAFSKGINKLRATRSSSGSSSSSYEQLGESLNQLDQVSRSIADSTGLTQGQIARIALGAGAHIGLGLGVAGIQGNANVDKNYSSGLTREEQRALSSMTSDQIAAFRQFGDRVTRDTSLVQAMTNDARESQELSARLASSASRSERADAALTERTAFAERVSVAHERGDAIAIDIAQDPHNLRMFTRYAEQYGGDSASAQVLMASELARQSLKPQRVFSDGTALPTNFDALAIQHHHQATDGVLAPDLAQRHQDEQAQVRGFQRELSPSTSTSTPSTLRDGVRTEGVRVRAQVAEDRGRFDDNAQTSGTPDGTLASQRPLLKRTIDQVQVDAAPLLDDTTRALKDVLRK